MARIQENIDVALSWQDTRDLIDQLGEDRYEDLATELDEAQAQASSIKQPTFVVIQIDPPKE